MTKLTAYSIAFSFGILTASLGFVSGASAVPRMIDDANDPGRVFSSYEAGIDNLPTSGTIRDALWSDTYWPSHFGGAAWRWQVSQTPGTHADADPHVYQVYPAWQISELSDEQLALLSPAEKYDIATGRFDYPTVRREVARTSPNDSKWHGLCHAVAAVTSRFSEPQNTNVVVTLPDGNQHNLMFYSSDIKALLALSADRAVSQTSHGIGQNCQSSDMNSAACWDTNPGSFYIALANMVGLLKMPILMDVDPGPEVWNAVVKSYSARLTDQDGISARAAPGTAREVRVDMTLQHTLGARPARGPVGAQFKTQVYAFTLEIDRRGNIIGGEWITKNRPDSLWKPEDNLVLDGNFSFLKQLTTTLR